MDPTERLNTAHDSKAKSASFRKEPKSRLDRSLTWGELVWDLKVKDGKLEKGVDTPSIPAVLAGTWDLRGAEGREGVLPLGDRAKASLAACRA